MTPGPLVSICIPTYKGARYIEEALRSAFAQTYPNVEFLVSDDRSQDDTLAIVDRVAREANVQVRVLHHEPAGIGANWNNCVRHAKGAYIKFLFQDDLLSPDCVERMMALAIKDPEVGLVYGRRRILHDATDPTAVQWVQRYGTLHRSWDTLQVEEGILPGSAYLGDPAFWKVPRNKIGEPTAVLLKTSTLLAEGIFDETLKQALDYVQWYKLMRHVKVGFVDAEVATFRLHAGQATSRNATAKDVRDFLALPNLYWRLFRQYVHPSVRRTLFKEGTALGRRLSRTRFNKWL